MQLTKQQMLDYIQHKRVMILGSAPSVTRNKVEDMENYDIIVRINNYKIFNECKRVDIFYSYFGRNIKKTEGDIINDDVLYIMCKYPLSDWGERIDGIQDNWGEVYEYRKDYFVRPHYIPDDKDFSENFKLLNRVPTAGISCMLDIRRFNPLEIYMTGFDFFESGLHNINEKWDKSGNHDLVAERELVSDFYSKGIIDVDDTIKSILCEKVQKS